MAAWIAVYMLLHVIRSILTFVMYSRIGPQLSILLPLCCLELVCFAIDISTVSYFSSFYHKMSKKSLEGLRRTTCWDRWNYTVIMYFIVGLSLFIASYRALNMLSYTIWYTTDSPDINGLVKRQP